MSETVKIERMGQGPEAIGHLTSGKTVFVSNAAPGDTALIEVVEEKSKFARARMLQVLEPSSQRVSCVWNEDVAASVAPWQHLSYSAQLRAKRANVVSNLQRIAGFLPARAEALVEECAPSKRQWGYRNKLEFGCALNSQGRLSLGFRNEGDSVVHPSLICPLAHAPIESSAKALQGTLRYIQGSSDLGIFRVGVRFSLRTKACEVALWTPPSSFPRAQAVKTLKSALKTSSIVRVLASEGKARKVKKVEVLDGAGSWTEEMCDSHFVASAPSFFQVNTAQAEKLVHTALSFLGAQFDESAPYGLDGMKVADLYSGVGTFSIPLALAGADVVAVEAEGSSVRDLRRNAVNNQVFVEVVGGDSARELPKIGQLDALVVDPPRAGLAQGVVYDIASAGPSKVVYISCNPATWARDVALFEQAGYQLSSVRPVDLFPQTYHVEVASCFTLQ